MIRLKILLLAVLIFPLGAAADVTSDFPEEPPRQKRERIPLPRYYEPKFIAEDAPKVRQLGKKWLALIDSIHTQEDLTVANIDRLMGMTMKEDPEIAGRYYLPRKQFTDVWWFTMYLPLSRAQQKSLTVKFLADPRKLVGGYATMTDVCLDLGTFHQALLKLGYQQELMMNTHSGMEIWYQRNKAYLMVFPDAEDAGEVEHDCVRAVSISAD